MPLQPFALDHLKITLLQQHPEGSCWGRWQEPSKGLMLPTIAHHHNKKKWTQGIRPAERWRPGTEQPPLHHTENVLSLPPWFAKLHSNSWSKPSGLSPAANVSQGPDSQTLPNLPQGSGCPFLFINAISKIRSTFYSLTNQLLLPGRQMSRFLQSSDNST